MQEADLSEEISENGVQLKENASPVNLNLPTGISSDENGTLWVDLALLKPNPRQPRTYFDDEKLAEAKVKIDEMQDKYKKSPKYLSLVAQYYYTEKKFDEALDAVNEFAKFDKNSPLIMIGGDETYEARCVKCWELPDAAEDAKKSNVLKFALK